LHDIEEALNQFHAFLHSDKFRGIEGGEEKDWIRNGGCHSEIAGNKTLTYY